MSAVYKCLSVCLLFFSLQALVAEAQPGSSALPPINVKTIKIASIVYVSHFSPSHSPSTLLRQRKSKCFANTVKHCPYFSWDPLSDLCTRPRSTDTVNIFDELTPETQLGIVCMQQMWADMWNAKSVYRDNNAYDDSQFLVNTKVSCYRLGDSQFLVKANGDHNLSLTPLRFTISSQLLELAITMLVKLTSSD